MGGVLAPARTPSAIIAKLNAAFTAALSDPEVRGKLKQAGVTPSPSSAEEFARYLREEIAAGPRSCARKASRSNG